MADKDNGLKDTAAGLAQTAQATAPGLAAPYAAKAGRTAQRMTAADGLRSLRTYAKSHKRAWDAGSHFYRRGVLMPSPEVWTKNAGSLAGSLKNTVLEAGRRPNIFGRKQLYTRVKPGQVDDYLKTVASMLSRRFPKGLKGGSTAAKVLRQVPVLRPAARFAGRMAGPLGAALTTLDVINGYRDEEAADASMQSVDMFLAPGALYGSALRKLQDIGELYKGISDDTARETGAAGQTAASALKGLLGMDDSVWDIKTRSPSVLDRNLAEHRMERRAEQPEKTADQPRVDLGALLDRAVTVAGKGSPALALAGNALKKALNQAENTPEASP